MSDLTLVRLALIAMTIGFATMGVLFVSDPQLERLERWSEGPAITESPYVGSAAGVLFLCAAVVSLLFALESKRRSFAQAAGLLAFATFPAGLCIVIGGALLTAEPGSVTLTEKILMGGFAIVSGLLALFVWFGIVLRVIVAITGSKAPEERREA